ncbi:hypothetical protein ACFL2I_02360 [Candidatus Omnitrophota bacterium]
MIELQFELAIFLYLLIIVFGILTVWLLFGKGSLRAKNTAQIESIWQCAICTYIYVDSKNQRFSVCPRCASYNERAKENPE